MNAWRIKTYVSTTDYIECTMSYMKLNIRLQEKIYVKYPNFLKYRTNVYINSAIKLKNRNIRLDSFPLCIVKYFKKLRYYKGKRY